MGGGQANSSMEPQHHSVQSNKLHAFRLMYGAEVVLPEEVKQRSLRTTTEAPACPNEAEEKDLLESDRLKAVATMQKYQEETRA
jgi:hypothetical protein